MSDDRNGDPRRYDDLLDHPYPVPTRRRRMTMAERAAQFAPFAALTGYGEAVAEAARETERRVEPGEAERAELDAKLRILQARLDERPTVRITRFVPDPRKRGGRYETLTGTVRRILPVEYLLVMADGSEIEIDDIVDIDGALFDDFPF